jgi:hypothetical protein
MMSVFALNLSFKVTEVKVHLCQVANNPPTSIQTMSAERQVLGPLVVNKLISTEKIPQRRKV